MGLMDGKKLLITGVLTDASLAFEVAKLAQLEGAETVSYTHLTLPTIYSL